MKLECFARPHQNISANLEFWPPWSPEGTALHVRSVVSSSAGAGGRVRALCSTAAARQHATHETRGHSGILRVLFRPSTSPAKKKSTGWDWKPPGGQSQRSHMPTPPSTVQREFSIGEMWWNNRRARHWRKGAHRHLALWLPTRFWGATTVFFVWQEWMCRAAHEESSDAASLQWTELYFSLTFAGPGWKLLCIVVCVVTVIIQLGWASQPWLIKGPSRIKQPWLRMN